MMWEHLPVKREWTLLFWLLLMAAAALAIRVPRLDLRPVHADEAVQAARFRDLWQEGRYVYDPHEFHGPTLIYATYPSMLLSGIDTFAESTAGTYRIVPVVLGAGSILLLWFLRDALGRAGTAWAAVFAACSPAFVFYSRYYIHETLLASFTLAATALGWRYVRSGRGIWCGAAGAALGLMQATKETAAIAYLAAALALAVVAWPGRFRQSCTGVDASPVRWGHLAVGALVATAVAVMLLSSFFTNPRGPLDGIVTYVTWLGRAGGDSVHIHAWHFYLQRLVWWREGAGPIWSEGLIVALALVGSAAGFLPRLHVPPDVHRGFARYLTVYTLAVMVLYTVIPYKTPWCLLQFLLGLVLLAGLGATVVLCAARPRPMQALLCGLLLIGVGHLIAQACRASYTLAADPGNPYVYAQTSPDIVRLEEQLQQLAEVSDLRWGTNVQVVWSDTYYWPLPWYLRPFRQVEWWTTLPENVAAPIVISSPQHDAELTPRLEDTHLMTGYFQIRPQLLAQLWVRMDLWEAHLRRLGRIP